MPIHKCSAISLCLIASFLLAGCTTLLQRLPNEFKSNEEIKLEQAMKDRKNACSKYTSITGTSVAPCETSDFGITKSSYLTYTEGRPFYHQVQTSGGTPPITFTYDKTCLPEGLILSSTGLLWGTGPSSGSYGCTVEATDQSGAGTPVKTTLFITEKRDPLSITKPSPLTYTEGKAFSYQLQRSGGKEPITFNLAPGSPPLPAEKLSLSPSGLISITEKGSGPYTFKVEATDSLKPKPQTASIDLAITPASKKPAETSVVRICIDSSVSPVNIVITPSSAGSGAPASGTICIEYNASPGNIVITPPSTSAGTAAKEKTSGAESKPPDGSSDEAANKSETSGTPSQSPEEPPAACKTPATVSPEPAVAATNSQWLKERQAYVEILNRDLDVTVASLEKTSKNAGVLAVGLQVAGIASGIAAAALAARNAAANAPWIMGLGAFTTGILALQTQAAGGTSTAQKQTETLKGNAETAKKKLTASWSWAHADSYVKSATPECWQAAMQDIETNIANFESVVLYPKFDTTVSQTGQPKTTTGDKPAPAPAKPK
jgi:hypothetical protein